MRKIVSFVLLIFVFWGTYWLYENKIYYKPAPADSKIVKIGAILPLTGDLSVMGESLKNAFLMAKQDVEKRELKNTYEFILDDDSFEPRKTNIAFVKQKSLDEVDATISFGSTTGQVIAPKAEEAKIIYVNIGASDANIAKGKYSFINWIMPEQTTRKMLEYHQKQGHKKVAFFAGNDVGVLTLAKAYEKQAPEFGIEPEFFYFQPNEKDFKMLLAKAEKTNPDAYVAQVWGGNMPPFIKQFHEAGINKPLTNIESMSMVDSYEPLEGIVFADISIATDDFYNRLKENFPNNPTEYATGNTYDAIMFLVEAFERADSKDKAVDELIKIKEYDGVVGKITQDEIGIFNSNAIIKEIKNGKPIVLED